MSLDEIEKKGQIDADAATQATRAAYDQGYFNALIAASKDSLDRWRAGAELVQKSAAAIGTLYAGILAVTFSSGGRQLPLRGVVPAIFLGLAIVLSTVYVAYSTHPKSVPLDVAPVSPPERMQTRLNNFLRIVTEAVERRAYWLRASVIALGLGVLFLPAPFIAFSVPSQSDVAAQYPWPSPAVPVDSIVLKAQVDEVAAQRQRALLGQSTTADLGLWELLTLAGLVLVLLTPKIRNPFRKPDPHGDNGHEDQPGLPYSVD
jgi:hypothetical protein